MNASLTIEQIATKIIQNEVGVFPCDTLWGIIGRFDKEVMLRIQKIKKRKERKPFIILIPNCDYLDALADNIPDKLHHVIATQWPGPLTILFKKSTQVPDELTLGHPLIGIRVPAFGPLNDLLGRVKQPLISTSVNISDSAPLLVLSDMSDELREQMDFIYSLERPPLQQSSTVIRCENETIICIREGAVDYRSF